jgi:hypothetical protein
MVITYYLGFTDRKRKYVEEKVTTTLISEQTSIATVRKHLLTVVSLSTPLVFCYLLPLSLDTKTYAKFAVRYAKT